MPQTASHFRENVRTWFNWGKDSMSVQAFGLSIFVLPVNRRLGFEIPKDRFWGVAREISFRVPMLSRFYIQRFTVFVTIDTKWGVSRAFRGIPLASSFGYSSDAVQSSTDHNRMNKRRSLPMDSNEKWLLKYDESRIARLILKTLGRSSSSSLLRYVFQGCHVQANRSADFEASRLSPREAVIYSIDSRKCFSFDGNLPSEVRGRNILEVL